MSPDFNPLLPGRQNMPPAPSSSDHSMYMQDPAILTRSSNNLMGDHFNTSSLFGSKPTTFGNNYNNNSAEETPHWMQSLQNLTTDNDNSPVNNVPHSSFSNTFHNSNIQSHGWPPVNNFSRPFNASQPPPGFQIRPGLGPRNVTKFGMAQNLLENQS